MAQWDGMAESDLSVRDLERVLDVVRSVASCTDFASLRSAVSDGSRAMVPGDLAHFMHLELVSGEVEIDMAPAAAAVPQSVALAAFEHHHPLAHHFIESGDGSAVRLSDVISREDYQALPIYREHYRHHRIEFQLGITIPCPETRFFSLGVNRADRDFSRRDVAVLDLLRPHLVQAARSVDVRTRLDGLLGSTRSTGDEDIHGLAIVRDGRVVDGDARVVDVIRDTFDADDVVGWSAHERRRLDSVDDCVGVRVQEPLVARDGGGRVVLRYVTGSDDAVVVDGRSSDDGRRLRGYGLTQREAEVLAALAQGDTNAQIGRTLGISANTVRKHLERVFRKLGVDSRTAAVAMAFEVFANNPPD